jgi:malonyl-CoA decarboxylase
MTRNLLNSKKAVKEFFKKRRDANLGTLVRDYYSLGEDEKRELLAMISQYSLSYDDFRRMADLLLKEEGPASRWQEKLRTLRASLVSPRERFFKSFVSIQGGLKFLLDLRGDLMRLGTGMEGFDWREMDQDIVFLLDMWFLEGFLSLSEIGPDTSYHQISFIKEHDMVHPMTSVEEMVKRLGKDRLCYGLYHVLLPHEPIIFIEVALSDRIVGSIREIMEVTKPIERPDRSPRVQFYYWSPQKDGSCFGEGACYFFDKVRISSGVLTVSSDTALRCLTFQVQICVIPLSNAVAPR